MFVSNISITPVPESVARQQQIAEELSHFQGWRSLFIHWTPELREQLRLLQEELASYTKPSLN